jgi:hypothetical protein
MSLLNTGGVPCVLIWRCTHRNIPNDYSGLDNCNKCVLTVLHNCVTTSIFSYTDEGIAPMLSKMIRPNS